jgi:hypothetical protein
LRMPIAWRSRFMSRATSVLVSCRSRLPFFRAHSASNRAHVLSQSATCRAPTGNGGRPGPGHPVRVATRPHLLASARFPSGRRGPADPCNPGCATAAYAISFAPDGHALTVVIDRSEAYPSTTDRDTVLTWQVASSGTLSDPATIFRIVSDSQPTLAPGDRIVADGSELGGKVHLWTVP